jgi:hypothetical protein
MGRAHDAQQRCCGGQTDLMYCFHVAPL